MTRSGSELLQAQELMHSARGVLRLCQDRAFSLSETSEGDRSELISSLARAIEVSNRLLLDALEIVDTFDSNIRNGRYDRSCC